MKYSKFTAPALLAIAATGIAAAPAAAAPAAPAPAVQEQAAPSVQGTDRGVTYRTELVEAGKSVVTTVTGGAFALSADAASVTLTNAAGEVVAQVPLAGTVDGAATEIAATLEADGTRLTLTPKAVAAKDISSQQWFMNELQRASTGGLVGAAIGALLGAIGVVTIIPGAIIGGVIGLLVAGGPSLVDAGSAYFSGQP
ncbi:hypothetical protein ACFXK0_09470 [Nocardia sp. NPDC059177]|uniref:hypothetical protein n=1 Tax=Nocardia sp. NPDC059177 TaxID=3346759 RepID=UPI0036966F55